MDPRTQTLAELMCMTPVPRPPPYGMHLRHPELAETLRRGAERATRIRRGHEKAYPPPRVFDGDAVVAWYTKKVRAGELRSVPDEDWMTVIEEATRLSFAQQAIDDWGKTGAGGAPLPLD